DGRDVRDYELRNLREQIAVVSQDVVLFDDTIRNNIAFGRELPDAAVERAAEAAHVLEFARSQPAGLDALVGDRGVLLSGGQRQRIAIARALLKDAPILILDGAGGDGAAPHRAVVSGARAPLAPHAAGLVVWRTDARAPPRLCLGLAAHRAGRQAGGGGRQSHARRHRQDAAHHLARAPADR